MPRAIPVSTTRATKAPIEFVGALAGCAVSMAIVWSYWPVLVELERTWARQPDYSHGYLVAPLAAGFLWIHRRHMPQASASPAPGGIVLLLSAAAMHVAGAVWYLPAFQAWSLPAAIAGAVWFLGGKGVLRWSFPAIAFLAFMLPLPYRVERSLSLPLQHVATRTSCWLLECLGEPAVNEGNVIVLHDARLLVAEACSGMRIFVSVLALAYAYAVLLDRPWWCKLVTLASVLPIAVVVNALRITVTGLLNEHLTTEAAHRFAHDASGWAMLPVAAGMLAIVPWYMGRLIIEAETANPPDLLSTSLAATGRAAMSLGGEAPKAAKDRLAN